MINCRLPLALSWFFVLYTCVESAIVECEATRGILSNHGGLSMMKNDPCSSFNRSPGSCISEKSCGWCESGLCLPANASDTCLVQEWHYGELCFALQGCGVCVATRSSHVRGLDCVWCTHSRLCLAVYSNGSFVRPGLCDGRSLIVQTGGFSCPQVQLGGVFGVSVLLGTLLVCYFLVGKFRSSGVLGGSLVAVVGLAFQLQTAGFISKVTSRLNDGTLEFIRVIGSSTFAIFSPESVYEAVNEKKHASIEEFFGPLAPEGLLTRDRRLQAARNASNDLLSCVCSMAIVFAFVTVYRLYRGVRRWNRTKRANAVPDLSDSKRVLKKAEFVFGPFYVDEQGRPVELPGIFDEDSGPPEAHARDAPQLLHRLAGALLHVVLYPLTLHCGLRIAAGPGSELPEYYTFGAAGFVLLLLAGYLFILQRRIGVVSLGHLLASDESMYQSGMHYVRFETRKVAWFMVPLLYKYVLGLSVGLLIDAQLHLWVILALSIVYALTVVRAGVFRRRAFLVAELSAPVVVCILALSVMLAGRAESLDSAALARRSAAHGLDTSVADFMVCGCVLAGLVVRTLAEMRVAAHRIEVDFEADEESASSVANPLGVNVHGRLMNPLFFS